MKILFTFILMIILFGLFCLIDIKSNHSFHYISNAILSLLLGISFYGFMNLSKGNK